MFVEVIVFFMLSSSSIVPLAAGTGTQTFKTEQACKKDLPNYAAQVQQSFNERTQGKLQDVQSKAACLTQEKAAALMAQLKQIAQDRAQKQEQKENHENDI